MLLLYLFVWPQWRANTLFIETEGHVVDKREVRWEDAMIPQVRVRYQVHGAELEHWNIEVPTYGMDEGRNLLRVRNLAVGERLAVWYDPAKPTTVLVERGYYIVWILYPILAGTGFFLLYGGGKLVSNVRFWLSSTRGG